MKQTLLQLALSLSVLCNCLSMWWISRDLRYQNKQLIALSELSLIMVEKYESKITTNHIPINTEKH